MGYTKILHKFIDVLRNVCIDTRKIERWEKGPWGMPLWRINELMYVEEHSIEEMDSGELEIVVFVIEL